MMLAVGSTVILSSCAKEDNITYKKEKVEFVNLASDYYTLEHDYIDIYKAKSAEEICEFVSRRIPFCDHCRYSQATYCHKWKASTKQISEWVIDEQAK